ncbi:MAG: hypothetical protein DHS20C11_07030 [Lysobacteraceae bacterium]|nr:MAG: hypothetical protein DHS20C11_07030 [Xanthomonadaceae bacterium]
MAFSEIEKKRVEKQMDAYIEKKRPPPHIRPNLDFGYQLQGQSVEVFEIRPMFGHPEKKRNTPVAKATYVKASRKWKLYWMRADLKWHRYEPHGSLRSLAEFFEVLEADDYGCFWG